VATGHGRVAAIDELRVNACADVAAEGVLGAGVKIAEAPGGEPGCALRTKQGSAEGPVRLCGLQEPRSQTRWMDVVAGSQQWWIAATR
jgi:hypothetical protein